MKKKLLALLSLVSFTILNAQTGYHIQHHTSSPYVKNKDSIYLSVGSTNKASVLLVDPNTKNWQYLNSSFLQAYGQISMKDKNNGIMLIATSNSVQVTSNGWQTVSTS